MYNIMSLSRTTNITNEEDRMNLYPQPADTQLPATPNPLRIVRDTRARKDLIQREVLIEKDHTDHYISSTTFPIQAIGINVTETLDLEQQPQSITIDPEIPSLKQNVVFLRDESFPKSLPSLNMNQHYLLYQDYVEGALQNGKRRNSDHVPHVFQTLGECRFEFPAQHEIVKNNSSTTCQREETENFPSPFSNDLLSRKRGSTLPPSFASKTHRRRPLFNSSQTIFQQVIMHDDLLFVVTEFLTWRDLLALTHTCSQLFNLGATLPYIWKNCLYSFKVKLEFEEQRLHQELLEKAELATISYCHFETFREVYEAVAVPAENKSVKCFEQMHDIMYLEGRQFFKKLSEESKARWDKAEQFFSHTSPRSTALSTLTSSNCNDILPDLLQPFSSSFITISNDSLTNNEELSPFLFSPQIPEALYYELYKEKMPLDWKGLMRYFYSPQSFYDACLADFSKLRKVLEFFQLSFKPYPELLILHTFYLNYNENANPKAFTSSTRAFVGWSFFFGKFLESNLHLIQQRNQNLQKRDELERLVLPFILKKFSRDFLQFTSSSQ
ncbi:hypothetical protein C9374_012037 [Naegleria lovaniensis]|uniref:F-box domain-containing protein n=1 Tax=Naegleria lovaniensis TaxID=51637 RepID=A0AA88GFC8_NAELO|nr:uncharacterized protein C9374_012037 [Naegleria lovaniensis]KAG2373574.1 hypothetical protein C9374_012037 [Naegleria lovaniensis]